MAIREWGDSKIDAIMWEEEDMIPTLTTMEGSKDFWKKRKEEEEELGLEPGNYMEDYVSGTGNWVIIDETHTFLYQTPDEAISSMLEGVGWRENPVVVVDLKLLPKLKADIALIKTIFTGIMEGVEGRLTFKLAE
jgi:hypothetical protein